MILLQISYKNTNISTYRPVPFEEVGLGYILPPDGGLNTLCWHAVPKHGNVLWVARLEHGVLEHPELLPCRSQRHSLRGTFIQLLALYVTLQTNFLGKMSACNSAQLTAFISH